MTSNIKPVGLYYEKKQPNQIEARNQFKTHDEIDRKRFSNFRCRKFRLEIEFTWGHFSKRQKRCFIFSGKYDEMGDQIMNEMDCVNETLDQVFVASRSVFSR